MLPIFCSALLGVLAAQGVGAPDQDPELARGIALAGKGEYEQAIVVLEDAARRLGARPEAARDAAQAYFHLGFAYVAEGLDTLARTSFREALRRDPSLELSVRDASPKVRELFEQGRQDLRAEGVAAAPSPPPAATPAPAASPATADVRPPAAKPSARSGGGSHKGLIFAGIGAAAAAGAALALAGGKEDPLATDDDRDGFSENQGDCNDANPSVNPGAGITLTVDFAMTGSFTCAAPNARVQTYTVRNDTCAAITVTGLSYQAQGIGSCSFNSSSDLRLSTTTVGPASSAVVRQGAAAGQGYALCCSDYPCRAGACAVNETYTVNTTAGSRSVTNSFNVSDPTGYDCRACSDVFSPRIQGPPGTPDACRIDP